MSTPVPPWQQEVADAVARGDIEVLFPPRLPCSVQQWRHSIDQTLAIIRTAIAERQAAHQAADDNQ